MRVLGIDPGLAGAAAVLSSDGRLVAIDLPTVGDGTKRTIDVQALYNWLAANPADHAFIELVNAMPGQGVASMFRFGMAYGSLRAVVALCGIPYQLVVPGKWKKYFNLAGGEKENARQLAIQLYPQAAALFALKRHHQRAEACLIAAYGLRQLNGAGK